jgi:acyl-coenzyme A synthetase/AMP-(fatty) acid ligase
MPHGKTWGQVTRCVQMEAERLGISATQPPALLATVPAQHMYGLESSVLLALHSGAALCAGRPFYPADIVAALAALDAPRILVSTPVHLRALLAAGMPLPSLALVVSATAPLSLELARDVEQGCAAPLVEIYGSTETGQIASRRPTQSPHWQLFAGVRLSERGQRIWAEGGHIETPTPLGDHVQILADGQFVLGERLHDVVNIAGKRNSIDYLNHQLLAIPGVCDGAFFLPEESSASHTGVVRLSAIVVAPGLDAATVLRQLRERIDPVFLPRPLLLVDAMPRNGTGKLPLQSLRSLLGRR